MRSHPFRVVIDTKLRLYHGRCHLIEHLTCTDCVTLHMPMQQDSGLPVLIIGNKASATYKRTSEVALIRLMLRRPILANHSLRPASSRNTMRQIAALIQPKGHGMRTSVILAMMTYSLGRIVLSLAGCVAGIIQSHLNLNDDTAILTPVTRGCTDVTIQRRHRLMDHPSGRCCRDSLKHVLWYLLP